MDARLGESQSQDGNAEGHPLTTEGYPPNSSLVEGLRQAIRRCELAWGREPAYFEISHLLDEALQKLDFLCVSPGHREAKEAQAEARQDSGSKAEYAEKY